MTEKEKAMESVSRAAATLKEHSRALCRAGDFQTARRVNLAKVLMLNAVFDRSSHDAKPEACAETVGDVLRNKGLHALAWCVEQGGAWYSDEDGALELHYSKSHFAVPELRAPGAFDQVAAAAKKARIGRRIAVVVDGVEAQL